MHDPLLVHVVQRAAQLGEVLPDGSFRNQLPLLLEVLDHPGGRKVEGFRDCSYGTKITHLWII